MSQRALSRGDLLSALRGVGIAAGDTVFFHVGRGGLETLEGSRSEAEACIQLWKALREAVGESGTLLVPTYSFSFCRQEPFDVQQTPASEGPWSPFTAFLEFFRRQDGVVRSRDPIHSVAGVGPLASRLLDKVPGTCFGPDSVFARLKDANGKICALGTGLEEMTFRHHVEELSSVPFRYRKLFTGTIRNGGVERKQGWIYSVRILANNGYPDARRLEKRAKEAGVSRTAPLGDGEAIAVNSREFFDLTAAALALDPWFTARGPACDPVQAEDERVGKRTFDISLPAEATMDQIVEGLWRLPRNIISDEFDAALDALGTQVPMTVHEYPSGTECWSWLVPEKWSCEEAYLETLDGRRLFSYADHPLHVVSYSLPFEGVVTREELFRHLHTHSKIPEAVPFIFKYYERDWGLCCSLRQKETLTDERYRVVIRSNFRYGKMRIGEFVAPGASPESIVLCSHLCHPSMVNDDMTGVAVGLEVIRRLRRRKDLRYTYRYVVVPETIGTVAFLSQNEKLVPFIRGGLFLEMLGLANPPALQFSFDGNTELDLCFGLGFSEADPSGWTGPYRTVIGNDERQYNGPGMRIPMLSLSRVLRPDDPNWPYREYHSNWDGPETTPAGRLEESAELVLHMIDVLERNVTPVNRFKGEVFCSRYGVFVDPYANPRGHRALFNIMDQIDGHQSVAMIARKCGVAVADVKAVLDELATHDLVGYAAAPGVSSEKSGKS